MVVPVIQEEVHADAKPVQTGGVRVTKSVETHDELVEQELRKGRAEVERIQMNRVVDGPQAPYRSGNILIIPVVSEVMQDCEKQWVLTEEIRITQLEETHTVQTNVPVTEEHARVERLDAQGNVTGAEATRSEEPVIEKPVQQSGRLGSPSIVNRRATTTPARPGEARSAPPSRKVLSSPKSILSNRPRRPGRKPS